MNLDLQGKVALVTGSGRGIGRAIALGLASEGATVIVNAVHEDNVARVVREVESVGGKAIPATFDISTEEAIEEMFQVVAARAGRLDILVNNAGINIVKPAIDLPAEDWDNVSDVNLRSVFLSSRTAAKRFMIPQGAGRIINISSLLGITPSPNRSVYAATKAAVIMLTRELATEWARYNINVNAIAPGFFLTDLLSARIKEGAVSEKAILKRVPLGRFGDVNELAALTAFLSSSQSKYITGQVITVDGGYSAYGAPE